MANPNFTAINLLLDTRDRLRAWQYRLTGQVERKVTLSEAVDVALRVAMNHPDEVARLLDGAKAADDAGDTTTPNGEAL